MLWIFEKSLFLWLAALRTLTNKEKKCFKKTAINVSALQGNAVGGANCGWAVNTTVSTRFCNAQCKLITSRGYSDKHTTIALNMQSRLRAVSYQKIKQEVGSDSSALTTPHFATTPFYHRVPLRCEPRGISPRTAKKKLNWIAVRMRLLQAWVPTRRSKDRAISNAVLPCWKKRKQFLENQNHAVISQTKQLHKHLAELVNVSPSVDEIFN